MTEILIAATPRDLRWARICLASVRRFHPEAPVRILPGAPLPGTFVSEIADYWNAGLYPLEPGEYGWGFVKLEPLFQEPGKRFLVLDADTILLGPVTQIFAQSKGSFLVDDETQTDDDVRRLYYDWDKMVEIEARAPRPLFVFNSGQWFGTSGLLTRDDFAHSLEWRLPRRGRRPDIFKQGEQGIFNYVLNEKHRAGGFAVERRKFMRWPGHGLEDLRVEALEANPVPQIIHWAGYKAPRLETLPYADFLLYFEKHYYEKMSGGERLREARARRDQLQYRLRLVRIKVFQSLQRVMAIAGREWKR